MYGASSRQGREQAKGAPSPVPGSSVARVVTSPAPVSHGPLATAGPMVQLAPVTRMPSLAQATPVQRSAADGTLVQRAPPPDLGEVMVRRIREAMLRQAPALDPDDVNDVQAFITANGPLAGIPAAVQAAVTAVPQFPDFATLEWIVSGALAGAQAQGGQHRTDSAYKQILGPVLAQHAYIQSIFNGTIHLAPSNASLGINTPAPSGRTTTAMALFNRLVDRQGLPNIDEERTWSPASAMGGSVLSLGWASPSGVVLHELGHHLEDHVSPAEFATVHNFLRARSRQHAGGIADMRTVGYNTLWGGTPTETGYDIEAPRIRTGRDNRSLLGLVGRGFQFLAGRLFGRDWGARGIENFFMGHANNRQVGYNTQVYGGSFSTEYISTTIEMLNRPDTARELVGKDPLRVALFLYIANRPVYNQVAQAFALGLQNHNNGNPAPLPVRTLDHLIHTI